jgi:hypothetical protein
MQSTQLEPATQSLEARRPARWNIFVVMRVILIAPVPKKRFVHDLIGSRRCNFDPRPPDQAGGNRDPRA